MALTKVSYSMINGAPANILDFGAVGDGSTDNSAAITAALAASDVVFIPFGTFNCDSSITMPAGTQIFGDGTLNFTNGSLKPVSDCIVDGLTITGNGNTNNDSAIVITGSVSEIIVRNCVLKDTYGSGITIANGANKVTVQGCRITNCGTPATAILPVNSYIGHGIYLAGITSTIVIQNNEISHTFGQAAIFIDSSNGVLIQNNYIHNTFWAGIRGYDSSGPLYQVFIDGNRLEYIGSQNTTGDAVGCNGIASFNTATQSPYYNIWDWVVTNNSLNFINENGIEGAGYIANNIIRQTNYRGLASVSPEGIYTQGPAKILNNILYYCGKVGVAGCIRVYYDVNATADVGTIEVVGNETSDPLNGYGISVQLVNGPGSLTGINVSNNTMVNGGLTMSAVSGTSYINAYVFGNKTLGGSGSATSLDSSIVNQFNNSWSPQLYTGTGSPEGVVAAVVGSLYTNVSGGTSTTLYVKTSGSSTTGWTAK